MTLGPAGPTAAPRDGSIHFAASSEAVVERSRTTVRAVRKSFLALKSRRVQAARRGSNGSGLGDFSPAAAQIASRRRRPGATTVGFMALSFA